MNETEYHFQLEKFPGNYDAVMEIVRNKASAFFGNMPYDVNMSVWDDGTESPQVNVSITVKEEDVSSEPARSVYGPVLTGGRQVYPPAGYLHPPF